MTANLEAVANGMVADGKGILAADESTGTIKKRFDSINVESTEDARRDYREMLFRSTDAMSNYVSGVILYDETLRQNAAGHRIVLQLREQGDELGRVLPTLDAQRALPGCRER